MRHCPASRLLVLVWLVLSLPLCAQQKPSYPNYTAHVNDFANVIDANTKAQLETILLDFEKRTNTQIAIVTMLTLEGRPLEDYANGLYRAWGIGAKSGADRDKGALLLVVTQDRRSRLEVGYGLEGDLPDGLAGEMLRRMRPYFQQQQWSEGLSVGTRTLVDTLAQKWDVDLEGIDRSYAYQPPPEIQLSFRTLLIIGFGFMFLIFILGRLARRSMLAQRGRRRGDWWWVAPMIFHQGGGGFGGSSWGNGGGWSGGSGGGWGGFGGGSSGGGGASDSW